MNILRELFFGKVLPFEQLHPASVEYKEAVEKSIKIGQDFESSLDEKQEQLYAEYTNARCQITVEELTSAFAQGFRLGIQILLATMIEKAE
ncbi:DUF6809 family protein [Acetivibrio sp. MSJd-27]|uniref:DUF6809 family protein n=1 Tax=Acetivibrio sp. MSJd-27 TaxID=2841523 RepID=UPI001C11CAC6|nr:DUF6809 family protein [Acetivibrio sp. MSJd-27]MBU5450055.1 hypothetical protein [Acetivibrio sp. MSJd-27]